jgi:hypothetical protein
LEADKSWRKLAESTHALSFKLNDDLVRALEKNADRINALKSQTPFAAFAKEAIERQESVQRAIDELTNPKWLTRVQEHFQSAWHQLSARPVFLEAFDRLQEQRDIWTRTAALVRSAAELDANRLAAVYRAARDSLEADVTDAITEPEEAFSDAQYSALAEAATAASPQQQPTNPLESPAFWAALPSWLRVAIYVLLAGIAQWAIGRLLDSVLLHYGSPETDPLGRMKPAQPCATNVRARRRACVGSQLALSASLR